MHVGQKLNIENVAMVLLLSPGLPKAADLHLTIMYACRAKFITGSVAVLLAKPGGGSNWLLNLRNVPYREASEALCELPGVGPKARFLHPLLVFCCFAYLHDLQHC